MQKMIKSGDELTAEELRQVRAAQKGPFISEKELTKKIRALDGV